MHATTLHAGPDSALLVGRIEVVVAEEGRGIG
jgi:hypothetical protein